MRITPSIIRFITQICCFQTKYGFIHLKIVSNEGLCLRGCTMKILLEHVKLAARSQPKVGDERPAEIHDSVVEVENRRLSMM